MRRERREQQQLAAELLSYVDPVTGEVLFQPNINRQIDHDIDSAYQRHHGEDEDDEEEDADLIGEELAAAVLRRKQRHDPSFWDRMSRGESGAQQQEQEQQDQQQHSHARSKSRSRSEQQQQQQQQHAHPQISEYSKLLAEIHRKRDGSTAAADSETVYDRLAKKTQPQQQHQSHHQHAHSSARGGYRLSSRSCSRASSTASSDATATTTDDDNFRPQLNANSKSLDPRRNERGMARINALLQHDRDRQRALEKQQEEQRRKEEEELQKMQRQQHHHHRHHHHHHQDPAIVDDQYNNNYYYDDERPTRQEQESFADRQAAWEARRRQKVQAKQAQKAEREFDHCTFQPELAPPPPPSMLQERGF